MNVQNIKLYYSVNKAKVKLQEGQSVMQRTDWEVSWEYRRKLSVTKIKIMRTIIDIEGRKIASKVEILGFQEK